MLFAFLFPPGPSNGTLPAPVRLRILLLPEHLPLVARPVPLQVRIAPVLRRAGINDKDRLDLVVPGQLRVFGGEPHAVFQGLLIVRLEEVRVLRRGGEGHRLRQARQEDVGRVLEAGRLLDDLRERVRVRLDVRQLRVEPGLVDRGAEPVVLGFGDGGGHPLLHEDNAFGAFDGVVGVAPASVEGGRDGGGGCRVRLDAGYEFLHRWEVAVFWGNT